jgi:hypothetical protein
MKEARWHIVVQLEHGVAVTFQVWIKKIVLKNFSYVLTAQ